MRRLRAWFIRITGIFNKSKRDRELSAELESHLQLHIGDNLRAGMSPQEARRRAIIKLGGIESTKENYRDRRSNPIIETLVQDIRFGLRMLRRNPGFAFAVVLTLALCIGANTAVFSVIHAVVLSPLGYVAPDRIVVLRENGAAGRGVSMPNAEDWRKQSDVFESMGVYKTGQMILTETDDFQRVYVGMATPSFFVALGVRPIQGRLLAKSDAARGAGSAVVLGASFWQTHYSSSVNIIGKTVRLGDSIATIAGVASFDAPFQNVAFWLPLSDVPALEQRDNRFLSAAVARLREGVSITQARVQMRIIDARLAQDYEASNANWTTSIDRLSDAAFGDSTLPVYLLFGATCFLLLLGCSNVSNLLVGRALQRRSETSVRLALGATRWRIARQSITEGVILAIFGGALGVLVAYWCLALLVHGLPTNLPRVRQSRIDVNVLLFTCGSTFLTALLFGTLSTRVSAAINPVEALKEALPGKKGQRWSYRQAAIVLECSLAMLLLTGAMLMAGNLQRLYHVGSGLLAKNAAAIEFQASKSTPTEQGSQNIHSQETTAIVDFIDRLRSQQGVESAGAISDLPIGDTTQFRVASVGGEPAKVYPISFSAVTPEYFRALGTRIEHGREFSNEDRPGSQPVAMVNETAARTFWPGGDALGKEIGLDGRRVTIIGVVEDVRRSGTIVKGYWQTPLSEVYVASEQGADVPLRWAVVRFSPGIHYGPAEVRQLATQSAADIGPTNVQALGDMVDRVIGPGRDLAIQFGFISLVATALAIVGIAAVLLRFVHAQMHDLGIRIALGAETKDVAALIIGSGMRLVLCGIAVGGIAALWLARLMNSLLLDAASPKWESYLAAAVLMLLAGLLGCAWPTIQALVTDPITALRHEG